MTQKRDKESRWIDDEYQIEGVRGKQWDLTGKLTLLSGVYNTTPPTLADGEAGFMQFTSDGKLIVETNVDSTPTAKVPASVVQVLAESPAPIALPAGDATAIYLQAARANGANAGNVFIGIVADLVSGTKNYITLTPGATWQYVCRPGTKVAMATFGIDGETATDGVIGYYEPV